MALRIRSVSVGGLAACLMLPILLCGAGPAKSQLLTHAVPGERPAAEIMKSKDFVVFVSVPNVPPSQKSKIEEHMLAIQKQTKNQSLKYYMIQNKLIAINVNENKILNKIKNISSSLLSSLDNINNGVKEPHRFELKQFSVELAVNGSGKVGFLGTGAEVGGSASFRLVFVKRNTR
ncbi:hypothetical protein AiwAL_11360 [Acidiphilium sp. AL]|uniref:Pepco domain-containing protein n=1 Tax=Acidiphilium iwatense TaxID=768198 RepID=A0ABS9DZF3_9PROT|nr:MULTISPECIES: hypothetical protein [Acidiphilium]MCF3947463.1 hypothetical protein [Acidiphilium iwatense]MCU4160700.1 hypothetical protein [Acidiphilium sp. AL]